MLIELEGLGLNQEVIENLKKKESKGKVKFIVYNGRFWDFYYNYPKYKRKHIMVLLWATVFLAVQGVLSLKLYEYFGDE